VFDAWAYDADAHVVEPWSLYTHEVAPAFQDVARRLIAEGQIWARQEGPGRGVPTEMSALSDRVRPGGRDPLARLPDMDSERIQAAVLFPSTGLHLVAVPDGALGNALCRAYNDWIARYCAAAPGRLFGAAVVNLWDVTLAIGELERAAGELGLRGVVAAPEPVDGRRLDDPALYPFYAVAEQLGMPILFHQATGIRLPTAGTDRFDNYFLTHAASHPVEQMLASATVLTSELPDRFPDLPFVFLESGCGWLPYWLERLDEHYEKLPQLVPWLTTKPSERFRRQCYISFDPEDALLPAAIDWAGADRVLFASDYPHWDGIWPNATRVVRERTDLSDAIKQQILVDNCQRLFRLPVPSTADSPTQ
jgi:predicted TIM-barrel fold metal-dependent hydrolase